MTARDIITATLRSIRVLGVGDALPAEDANDALASTRTTGSTRSRSSA